MKFDVNIDVTTKERGDDYLNDINNHIQQRQPFIIYYDKEHYVRVSPYHLALVGYDEQGEHQFQCTSMDEFFIRLKLFVITHNKFHSCIPQIEQDAYRQLSKEVKTIEIK